MLSLRFGFLVAWLDLRLAIGIVRLGWGLVRRQRETREGWGGFGAVDPGREQRWVVRTVAFVEIDRPSTRPRGGSPAARSGGGRRREDEALFRGAGSSQAPLHRPHVVRIGDCRSA